MSVEQRFRDAHAQNGAAVCYAVQRYRYMDLMPCTSAELDFMGFARTFPVGTSTVQQTSAQQGASPEFPMENEVGLS